MADVDAAIATFERNIAEKTGRSVEAWVEAANSAGLEKHGAVLAWLKSEHGFSHGHANHVAKRALEARTASDEDPVTRLFSGKEGLRPLFDALRQKIEAFGPDVAFAPKKVNVSVRRKKQFALLQPSTRTRLDVGLILPRPAAGRLEASGSFNAMFSHRVRVETLGDVDAELIAWLAEAYALAG